jgi:hypothetical protein
MECKLNRVQHLALPFTTLPMCKNDDDDYEKKRKNLSCLYMHYIYSIVYYMYSVYLLSTDHFSNFPNQPKQIVNYSIARFETKLKKTITSKFLIFWYMFLIDAIEF